jgi:hypothetical protein
VFFVIADFWSRVKEGIEKNELRGKFPGIGGDALNASLARLLASKAVAEGSCGCCYGLPEVSDGRR